MMFLIHWFLALITLTTIPFIICVNLLVTKRIPPLFVKQQKALSSLNAFCEEIISGVKIISVFKMQDQFVKKFDEQNDQLTHNSILAQKNHFVDTVSTNFQEFHPCKMQNCHALIDKIKHPCYNGSNNQANML